MAAKPDRQQIRDVIIGVATRLYNRGEPNIDEIVSAARSATERLGVTVDQSEILSAAAEAYNTLVAEGSKPAGSEITGDVITGQTGDAAASRFLIEGVFTRAAADVGGGEVRDVEIPFSIDTDLFLTPFELLEILENSEIGEVRSMLDDSPGLRKRLESLEFERIAPDPGNWQAAVTEIIERINEKQLGG